MSRDSAFDTSYNHVTDASYNHVTDTSNHHVTDTSYHHVVNKSFSEPATPIGNCRTPVPDQEATFDATDHNHNVSVKILVLTIFRLVFFVERINILINISK